MCTTHTRVNGAELTRPSLASQGPHAPHALLAGSSLNPMERWSLVALWWGTAWVSWLGWGGISHELVQAAGWVPLRWVSRLVALGLVFDVVMGVWIVWRPGPWAYRAGFVVVLGFTLLATAMAPSAWLHPFGPLLKNLPILALLWRGCEMRSPWKGAAPS